MKQTWQDRFDEDFSNILEDDGMPCYAEISQFIDNELKMQKDEIVDIIKETAYWDDVGGGSSDDEKWLVDAQTLIDKILGTETKQTISEEVDYPTSSPNPTGYKS